MIYYLENEIWVDIKEYEGLYQVSNLGHVKSMRNNKILKQNYSYKEYDGVKLYKKGFKPKSIVTHILVAQSFLNYDVKNTEGLVCDHINENKHDNRLENLKIITHRQNVRKSILKKDTPYYGVYKVGNKWRARFYFKNKPIHLGYFLCDYEAHISVENKIKELENGR